MAKKRQQDFNKTQIKPGRNVAKRKNVTNTSFKSKKVAVPDNELKMSDEAKTISDYMNILQKNTHTAARTSALKEMDKLITSDKESLFSNLADVIQLLLKICIDCDDNLRDAAAKILENVLQASSDLHLQSFVPIFINYLSSAMTNANMKIKEHSLKILTPMLKMHPNLFAHSSILVNHLLQMLLGSSRTRTHSQMAKQTHKQTVLPMMYSDGIYSPVWRVHLLGHINIFLKGMLENKSIVMNDDPTEQSVYWDSGSPLHLQIYACGGLKPYDVEKSYSNCISSDDDDDAYDDCKIIALIDTILHIIPPVFTEELTVQPKSDDNLLDGSTISNLNILMQVLCSIFEWLKILCSEDLDKELGEFLRIYIYEAGKFPFKKRGAVLGRAEKDAECVQLNLSICYLYCSCLLESVNKQTLFNSVFSYIEDVFSLPIDVKYKSIPLLVKILYIFFQLREDVEISEFLCKSLCQLCSLLKISDDHPNRSLLISLFAKMSLDSAYHFVAETDAMKDWFKWLINKVMEMPKTGNVDKTILQVAKKIANRRYSCFQKFLMNIDFSLIKAMLRFDHDDVRDTAIFLLYNMRDINMTLLDNIARVILIDSTLPMKFSVRLIRLLTYRFFEKPEKGIILETSIYSLTGLIDIVQFLLNIAIDTFNMTSKRFIDLESNEYAQALKVIKDVAPYVIVPSLHWNEHSVLFEVCARFLNQLPKKKVLKVVVDKLFEDVLDNCRVLPMHSVISILKLNNCKITGISERYYHIQMSDLIFSVMLTTSVLTHMPMKEDWYYCNVTELLDNVELNDQEAIKTLKQVEFLGTDALESIAVYHILRMYNFFIRRKLLSEDPDIILTAMEILKKKCPDKTIEHQPLFISVYNQCKMLL